jgi:hypothetical protein
MPTRRLLAIATVGVVAGGTWLLLSVDLPPSAGSPGPVGVWKVDGPKPDADASTRRSPSNSFRYDGSYVTLLLAPRWTWEWHPSDDYWRLESRWQGGDLYCRGPYGNWWKVATFTDGHFHNDGWTFEKVSPWDLNGLETAFLWRRPPYDYTLDPSQRGRGRLEWLPAALRP